MPIVMTGEPVRTAELVSGRKRRCLFALLTLLITIGPLQATPSVTVGKALVPAENSRGTLTVDQPQATPPNDRSDLLRLANQARAGSENSPNKASDAFIAAIQQRFGGTGGLLQGRDAQDLINGRLKLKIEHSEAGPKIFTPRDHPPSVQLLTPRDHLILDLLVQLRELRTLTLPPLTSDICIIVNIPDRVDTTDIERLVLLHKGTQVAPRRGALRPTVLTSGVGVSVTRHAGEVCWASTAFAASWLRRPDGPSITEAQDQEVVLILYLNEGNPVEVGLGGQGLGRLNEVR
jgi:hypothetical protein